MTAVCVLVNLVHLICADLSILSYRIRNITIKSKKDVHLRIRSLINMHLKTTGKLYQYVFDIYTCKYIYSDLYIENVIIKKLLTTSI